MRKFGRFSRAQLGCQHGLSLLEVIVASAIGIFVIGVVTQSLIHTLKIQGYMLDSEETARQSKLTEMILSETNSCTETFVIKHPTVAPPSGSVMDSGLPQEIFAANGSSPPQSFMQIGQKIGRDLVFEKMEIEHVQDLSVTSLVAKLNLIFKRSGINGFRDTIRKTIPLRLVFDSATRTITSCAASAGGGNTGAAGASCPTLPITPDGLTPEPSLPPPSIIQECKNKFPNGWLSFSAPQQVQIDYTNCLKEGVIDNQGHYRHASVLETPVLPHMQNCPPGENLISPASPGRIQCFSGEWIGSFIPSSAVCTSGNGGGY